jgi:eukaryotic-like serine/threonine-protein kinase
MLGRLSEERWKALIPHLDRALDLSPEERLSWLAALRAEDASLADDLQELLARHDAIDAAFLNEGPEALTPAASLAGQVLGAYTLRSQIGQGGMGTVWLAERSDGRYEGTAAVKLLNASLIGRDGEARFRREASILARLQHPHIAHLVDAGISHFGHPYLVLERIDGERIDRHCDARHMGIEARIVLFLEVLAAIAHAHANLIVHRDIKPSNVLVDTGGRVKLLDFGIAKLLEGGEGGGERTVLSRDGASALTPEYAAPEQLTGGTVTTATDVYALGVLLYLLLTGRHPAGREAGSPAELVRAIVDTEPARVSDAVTLAQGADVPSDELAARRASTPRKLRGVLRGDLDNIVAKALKKSPSERYASAEAMADDLRRYLGRQPVRARADSFGYRTRKFVSRNRVPLAAAAVAVLALVAGTGIAVWQARTAARERDRALVELNRAEATNDLSSFLLSEATPAQGRPITNAEVLARGEALIDRRFEGEPELRVHMLIALSERYHQNDQFDRWQATVSRAFTVSRGIADVGLRSRAACVKAAALDDQGQVAEGDQMLAAALRDLAQQPDPAAEAYCRVCEANMANRRADAPRAVAAAERAVALEEGRRGPAGRGFEALFLLATSYLVAGRSAAADGVFQRLMEMLEGQGRGDTRDAALVLNNWSTMLQNAGQHLRAAQLSERAVRIARERDGEHGAGLALLRSYGNALCMVGRCAEAVPFFEEAVAKSAAAGSARRRYATLTAAANAQTGVGNLARAAELLEEAKRLLEAGRAEMPRQQALLELRLAQLALRRGDHGAAAAMARRAAARHEDLRLDFPTAVQVHVVLAEAENERGDFAAARAAAERARALAESEGAMPRSTWAGRARLEVGVALAGLGDHPAAREELRRALDHLLASVGPGAPFTRRALAQLERLGP